MLMGPSASWCALLAGLPLQLRDAGQGAEVVHLVARLARRQVDEHIHPVPPASADDGDLPEPRVLVVVQLEGVAGVGNRHLPGIGVADGERPVAHLGGERPGVGRLDEGEVGVALHHVLGVVADPQGIEYLAHDGSELLGLGLRDHGAGGLVENPVLRVHGSLLEW